MPNIRVLMWNIKWFSTSSVKDQNKLSRILNRVQPVGPLPLYDVFIIIEPNRYSKPKSVGQVITKGASITALQTLFYALYARNPNWRLVPPRTLTTSANKEIHGVFYNSAALEFLGPDNVPVGLPDAYAVPPALAALAPALAVNAFGAHGSPLAPAGQVRHFNSGGVEVNFPASGAERRPYRTQFRTTGPIRTTFDIYSHHAPPEGRHPRNHQSIQNLALIREIRPAAAMPPLPPHPTLVTGDFNCCTFRDPATLNCLNASGGSHHAAEILAQTALTAPGPEQFTTRIINDKSSLKGVSSLSATAIDYRNHAFDHMLTKGIVTANARVEDVIGTDAGYALAIASGNTGTLRAFYKKIFAGKGISDHMPVRIDLLLP